MYNGGISGGISANRTGRKSMAGGIFSRRLSDKAVKAFVAKGQRGKKLADGGGLYLLIPPAGQASWRIKYRIEGKEKTYSIGTYPDVSLATARAEQDSVKALLREGKGAIVKCCVWVVDQAAIFLGCSRTPFLN
jgi:Arm domain-containing DNA-binding protein